jgi:hypothetical protein
MKFTDFCAILTLQGVRRRRLDPWKATANEEKSDVDFIEAVVETGSYSSSTLQNGEYCVDA